MATRALNAPTSCRSKKGRNSGEPDKGASRIPCPRIVAIGPSSRILGAEPFVPYMAGLDKLMVSLWLDGDGFSDFRRRLQEFKDEFNDRQLCRPDCSERSFDFGWEGVSFNMQRTGAGKYPYKLQSGDITLLFSNHKANAPFPNCRIEIGSMSCWLPGWKELFDRFTALLHHLGCKIRKQNVMEFHITADLFDVDFTETGLVNYRRWISKVQRIGQVYENYKPSYVSLGKGDFMLRCYDKTVELLHDSVKKDFFQQLWFDQFGYVPEHVTRIEFQIRRAVSKELQINTVGDLASKLNAVWQYCCGSSDGDQPGWARFVAKDITDSDRRNKHHNRYATAVIWDFVRSVQFGQGRTFRLERIKLVPQVNIDQLEKQAAGCLLSICAARGMHPDDLDGHTTNSMNIIVRQLETRYLKDRNEYVRKIETKRNLSKNTLFDGAYDDCHFTRDSFARHDHPRNYRAYYRAASVQ